MYRLAALRELFKTLEINAAKAEKGNKSAALRVRKGLIAIKKESHLMRQDMIAISKEQA